MKTTLLVTGLAIIMVLTVLYFNITKKQPLPDSVMPPVATTTSELPATEPAEQPIGGKVKADTFTGTLESVDTGCFADGECYIMVDGKHVTVIMGWSQDTVGTIIGAPSFGDLEGYIGKPVEVYAKDNADGTYSLYGSAGFYVKVLGETASSTLPNSSTGTTAADGCMIGGCSSQLCVEETDGNIVTNCMYSPQYACYKTAECRRQTTGQCGWTETPALAACMKDAIETPQAI